MRLETVTVKRDGMRGLRIINVSDFDPEKHVVFDAPVDDDSGITREVVAKMGKADVRELLEAHGVEVEVGAKVDDMRAALSKVMFVDDADS